MSAHHCGRMDDHPAHEWIYRVNVGVSPLWPMVVDCPGALDIEGGSLDLHDCGSRAHPSEIRACCNRCETTICNNCAPCRRVS